MLEVNLKIDPTIQEDQINIIASKMTPKLEKILSILQEKEDIQIVPLELDDRVYLLSIEQISHVVSEQNKCFAIHQNQKYRYKGTLKQFEELVQHRNFIRISKYCLANISSMKYFEATFGGSLVLVFKNGQKEMVSRKYAKELKKALLKE